MPGQMGSKRATVQGLCIMAVDVDTNTILIKGAVPGHQNTVLSINRSQKKAFKDLDEVKLFVVHKVNPMKQSKAKAKGKK